MTDLESRHTVHSSFRIVGLVIANILLLVANNDVLVFRKFGFPFTSHKGRRFSLMSSTTLKTHMLYCLEYVSHHFYIRDYLKFLLTHSLHTHVLPLHITYAHREWDIFHHVLIPVWTIPVLPEYSTPPLHGYFWLTRFLWLRRSRQSCLASWTSFWATHQSLPPDAPRVTQHENACGCLSGQLIYSYCSHRVRSPPTKSKYSPTQII